MLAAERARALAELRASAEELGQIVERRLDVAGHVREHPLLALGLGGAAGFTAGALLGGEGGAQRLRGVARSSSRMAGRLVRTALLASITSAAAGGD